MKSLIIIVLTTMLYGCINEDNSQSTCNTFDDCATGFCEAKTNTCQPDPCTVNACNNGSCSLDQNQKPLCNCNTGYTPDNRELICVEVCSNISCSDHGTCKVDAINNQPLCQCDQGYTDEGITCVPENICTDGDEQTLQKICGFNKNGYQQQICKGGQWLDFDICIDSDICKNGTTQVGSCGFGDETALSPETCINGDWIPDGVCSIWIKQFGTEEDDQIIAMVKDTDHNIYLSGVLNTTSGFSEIFLKKYASTGDLIWTRYLNSDVRANIDSITIDNFNNIYIVGRETTTFFSGSTTHNMFLAKFDSYGAQLWLKGWKISMSGIDIPKSIYFHQNTLYVTGSGGDNAEVFITKFNLEGEKKWEFLFGSFTEDNIPTTTIGNDLTIDQDGNILITGKTYGAFPEKKSQGYFDLFLMKLDSTGKQLWLKQWGTDQIDSGETVTVDHNGDIYITGNTQQIANMTGNITITKFNSNGTLDWNHEISNSGSNVTKSTILNGNDLFILATSNHCTPNKCTNILLLQFSLSKELIYEKEIGNSEYSEIAHSFLMQDNLFWFGGYTNNPHFGDGNSGKNDALFMRWQQQNK